MLKSEAKFLENYGSIRMEIKKIIRLGTHLIIFLWEGGGI